MNPELMSENFIDEIKQANNALGDVAEADRIRVLCNQFRERDYTKSHLAVLFMKDFSLISRILRDPNAGRGVSGRPRALTRDQEDQIIEYVRSCQISGHCVTLPQITEWTNRVLENTRTTVSRKFISMNNYIMGALDIAAPQHVEDLRIEACYYENFVLFFNRLRAMHEAYNYLPDLIINVGETTTNAEKCKRTTKVLFDPTIDVRPMATIAPKAEHITLCCAAAASGKHLRPVFIIKNWNVTVEDEAVGLQFDCGNYGLCWSPNGWQDAVSASFNYFHCNLTS